MGKLCGAAIAALILLTAGAAQAAPMVSIGQGTDVWRTYSCVAAPPGAGYRGAIIATAVRVTHQTRPWRSSSMIRSGGDIRHRSPTGSCVVGR